MTNMASRPDLCWIASYPRSGNTFFRIVVSNVLFGAGQEATLDRDIPEYAHPTPVDIESARRVPSANGEVVFAKTHFRALPPVDGIRNTYGLYVYRHPMDVFLSGLNYVYINAATVRSFREYFIDGRPKTVENIAEDGQLDHYFQRFQQDDGIAPFHAFSGGWSESLISWHRAAIGSGGNIVCMDYADLISQTEAVASRLFLRMGIPPSNKMIKAGVERARASTKVDGKFYWRGRPGVFRDFLKPDQLKQYFAKYQPAWSDVGVSFSN